MGPRFYNWLMAMNEVDAQRIALRNLAFDIRHGRVRRYLLRSFVEFVEKQWPEDEGRRPVPEAMIRRFTRIAEPPPRLCRGKPRPTDVPYCSRIMEARSLWCYHLTPEAVASIEDDVSDEEIERIAIVGIGGAARGLLRSEIDFAWITQADRVEELRAEHQASLTRPHSAFATSLRDALGLYHYIRQEKLIEVRYPEHITRNYMVAPPTFFEGLDLVFRSADGGEGWGRTVPLSGDTTLPEAVHEPIPFTGDFEIRAVGRPVRIRLEFDWQREAGAPDIVDELVNLIDQFLKDDHDD